MSHVTEDSTTDILLWQLALVAETILFQLRLMLMAMIPTGMLPNTQFLNPWLLSRSPIYG